MKKLKKVIIINLIIALCITSSTHIFSLNTVTTLSLPSFFSNGMMFEQKKPMKIWGQAPLGQTVTINLIDSQNHVIISDTAIPSTTDGKWEVSLPALDGSYQKYSLSISADINITISNVVIGELWLSCGQSNMNLTVIGSAEGPELLQNANNEYIRFFMEPTIPAGSVSSNQPYDIQYNIINSVWGLGNNKTQVANVSAISYNFALKLESQLNMPVGVINTSVGGTTIDTWMSRNLIENSPEIKSYLESKNRYLTIDTWNLASANNYNQMTALFNQKIAPLAGMNIAGVIWYQGEANVREPDYYKIALTGMMNDWGIMFNFDTGTMPFIYSHIAPYYYGTALDIPGYFSEALSEAWSMFPDNMAQLPIYDNSLEYYIDGITGRSPIHPIVKAPIGLRMANSAMSLVYGDGLDYTSPIMENISIIGNKIYIKFNHVGNGLQIKPGDEALRGFAICDSNRIYLDAKAQIVSFDTVSVWNETINSPVAVSYAFTTFNMKSNLLNSQKFPLAPFRSDKIASTFYNPKDWQYCDDVDLWIADGVTGDFKAAWKNAPITGTINTEISFDPDFKSEGEASLKLSYTADNNINHTIGVGPVLGYIGTTNQFDMYDQMTFKIYNPDNRQKLFKTIKIQTTNNLIYNATIFGENASSAIIPVNDGDWHSFSIDFNTLIDSDNNIIIDTKSIMAIIKEFQFTFEDDSVGLLYIDDITFGLKSNPILQSSTLSILTTLGTMMSHDDGILTMFKMESPINAIKNIKHSNNIFILIGLLSVFVFMAAILVVLLRFKKRNILKGINSNNNKS